MSSSPQHASQTTGARPSIENGTESARLVGQASTRGTIPTETRTSTIADRAESVGTHPEPTSRFQQGALALWRHPSPAAGAAFVIIAQSLSRPWGYLGAFLLGCTTVYSMHRVVRLDQERKTTTPNVNLQRADWVSKPLYLEGPGTVNLANALLFFTLSTLQLFGSVAAKGSFLGGLKVSAVAGNFFLSFIAGGLSQICVGFKTNSLTGRPTLKLSSSINRTWNKLPCELRGRISEIALYGAMSGLFTTSFILGQTSKATGLAALGVVAVKLSKGLYMGIVLILMFPKSMRHEKKLSEPVDQKAITQKTLQFACGAAALMCVGCFATGAGWPMWVSYALIALSVNRLVNSLKASSAVQKST